jgi:hypothetical protein
MTPAMWDELAKSLRWLRANADVLADVHWVGGDPVNGTSQACYGWAAWNSRKGTLALRNPTAATSSITLTLANALELPDGAAASYTALAGYADQRALPSITGASLAAGATLTFELQPFEVLVFDLWPAGATPPAAPLSAAATTPGTFGAWAAAQGIAVTDDPGSRLTDVLTRPLSGTSDSVGASIEASDDLQSWDLPVFPHPGAPLGSSWWEANPGYDRAFFRIKVGLK